MSAITAQLLPVRRFSRSLLAACALALVLLAFVFRDALASMWDAWVTMEVYSHGLLIPFIAAFLVWQRRDVLERLPFDGSWWGLPVVACGVGMNLLGQFATVLTLQQYGFLMALYGVVLTLAGWRVLRVACMPMLILLFMVPLPNFFLNSFSAQLQLISSQLGVWFVRLFGISVFVEGNVIDLGSYKLQVAEACDGLRYLFPLMTLAFIMAYFFKVRWWQRALLFASSIPITILMNSLRIGIIGVMVEHWGTRMAEGFLHEFQGWVVFMASAALLLAEMTLLARLGRQRQPWRQVFGLEFPAPSPAQAARTLRPVSPALGASIVLLLVCVLASVLIPRRNEIVPARTPLLTFPQHIGTWDGRRDVMEQIYLDTLKLDDYLIANFLQPDRKPVNFYVAWYDSQRSGESAHSPRSCLPGGGWDIQSLEQIELGELQVAGGALRLNRVVIGNGRETQLVYYWFQQRGRVITNEYLVKWYLFVDALLRNRTDGALVRLVSPVLPGEAIADVDRRLQRFAMDAVPYLDRHIPD